MRRLAMFAVLAGVFCAFVAFQSRAQVAKGVATGTLKKIDPKTGTIVLDVQMRIAKTKKKENKDYTYTINDDTKVVLLAGEEKQELFGKKALSNPLVKLGAQTSAFFDKNNKVYEVRFGPVAAKKK